MKRLNVGIIGCGPSGLVTLKELIDEGHTGTIFEKLNSVGGIFKTVYQQGFMVSSNPVTMFSDFVGEEGDKILEKPRMLSFLEYSKYLDDYAEHFKLKQYIKFETCVESVWRDVSVPNKWHVRVKNVDQEEQEFVFDRIAVCSGTHQLRAMPVFVGQDRFQGKIKHMQDVKLFEEFTGKRVCVVGSGEAASDMTLASAKFGTKSFVSIRKDHGFIVPRYVFDRPADLDTNRIRNSIPYHYGVLQTGIFLYYNLFVLILKQLMNMGKRTLQDQMNYERTKMNLKQLKTGNTRNTYGTKNSGIVEALVNYGCQRKPGIKELKATSIVFDDNTEEEVDEIVCCTGFGNHFAFLETEENAKDVELRQVAKDAQISHNLYKHCVHPLTGVELFFIGFVRPCFGAIPPLAEMQARWYAQLCSGNVQLVDKETLIKHSEIYVKRIEDQFTPYRTNRIVALTDHVMFGDEMSRLIGCRPNFVRMFFTDPKLWLKCQMGVLMNSQYRLCGPHAEPKEARRIIMKTQWAPSGINFIQLAMLYVFSIFWFCCGFRSCKPDTWYPVHECSFE